MVVQIFVIVISDVKIIMFVIANCVSNMLILADITAVCSV